MWEKFVPLSPDCFGLKYSPLGILVGFLVWTLAVALLTCEWKIVSCPFRSLLRMWCWLKTYLNFSSLDDGGVELLSGDVGVGRVRKRHEPETLRNKKLSSCFMPILNRSVKKTTSFPLKVSSICWLHAARSKCFFASFCFLIYNSP